VVTWGIIPLLVVIGVPLLFQLAVVLTGMGIAAHAAFVRFPERIAVANDELRRRNRPGGRSASGRSPPPQDAAASTAEPLPRHSPIYRPNSSTTPTLDAFRRCVGHRAT
jgi:hypothetical protein